MLILNNYFWEANSLLFIAFERETHRKLDSSCCKKFITYSSLSATSGIVKAQVASSVFMRCATD